MAKAAFLADPQNAYKGRVWLQVLVGAGQLVAAREVADDLARRFPSDAQLWSQLGYLAYMQKDFKGAQAAFARAQDGDDWTAEQRQNLCFAEADSASSAGDAAGAVAALRKLGDNPTPAIRLKIGRAQLAAHDRRAAVQTARRVMAETHSDLEYENAEALLEEALQPGSDPRGDKQLNLGYAYLRQHDDVAGLAAFERGFAFGNGKAFHYADAAYAAKRVSDNATAIAFFRFALDLNEREQTFTPQRVFGFRREIEVMERHWGVLLGSPYHAGTLDVWQAGVEAYWQPPVIGFRDGRILQFFARGYENFRNGSNGPIGFPTLQETVGLRYKPLATQNIALTAERLMAVGRLALNDWLFRVGYSTGDGTDLRIDRADWASWQIYGEANYYLGAKRLLIGTEVRYGVTLPLPRRGRLTLYPHALIAAEFDSSAVEKLVDAAGAGLSIRLWFGEDRYHAPPGWLEINGQYRFADAERGQGPGLRATLSL